MLPPPRARIVFPPALSSLVAAMALACASVCMNGCAISHQSLRDAGPDVGRPDGRMGDGGCPPTFLVCPDAGCTDPNDPMHCHACETVCPAAPNARPACRMERCAIDCNTDFENCDSDNPNGCETNIATNVDNCGACGRRCPSAPNSTPVCTARVCGIVCADGWGDCNRNAADGCETPTTTAANCGGCSSIDPARACPIAMPFCNGRACITNCPAGQANCSMTCADLMTDPRHCGNCPTSCPVPANANARCTGGVCGISCVAPYGNCNMMPADGCETNTSASVPNCGGCGRACPRPANASATCLAAVCGFVCVATHGDCNRNAADGCEAALDTVANCGRCGNACIARPNTIPTCAAGGLCTNPCVMNFLSCDGDSTNGCESDTRTDRNNCGMCGRVCGAGEACCGGSCIANDTVTNCGTCGRRCAAGEGCCGGACVSLASNMNCGVCGRACPGAQACCAGSCVPLDTTLHCGSCAACAAGQLCCGGTCVAQNTVNNCGACSNMCAGGQGCCGPPLACAPLNTTTNCGVCGRACTAPAGTCCASTGGGCANLTNDNANCGACGTACTGGQRCCGSTCIAVNTNANCGGCGMICTAGTTCCGSPPACVNTNTDRTNCGTCGTVCGAGMGCCGGTCTLLNANPNCGACGVMCTGGNMCCTMPGPPMCGMPCL